MITGLLNTGHLRRSRSSKRRADARNRGSRSAPMARVLHLALPHSERSFPVQQFTQNQSREINGVAVDQLAETIRQIQKKPQLADFEFRVRNQWERGGHSMTTVEAFRGVEQENPHASPFQLEADEPPVLLGRDLGPNPVEHLLNALVTCLTGALVYHAAARGIRIDKIESHVEGKIDLRGFLGISSDVPRGYHDMRVTFRVESDASEEKLRECAEFSPVYNTLLQPPKIELRFE
jgi:uncharacterized OsmC-like protein